MVSFDRFTSTDPAAIAETLAAESAANTIQRMMLLQNKVAPPQK
jgi:hypothetical protein